MEETLPQNADTAGVGAAPIVGRGAVVGAGTRLGAGCQLGERVVLGDGVIVREGARIGDDVRIGAAVVVGAHARLALEPDSRQPPLVIEDGVYVGEEVIVRTGLTVGRGARLESGTVVESSVPCDSRVTGQPGHVEGAYVGTGEALPGGARLIPFRQFLDGRGRLSVGETSHELPFVPNRLFVVDRVPGEARRGGHAHHACHQFLFCAGGSCVVMLDDGRRRAVVVLESVSMGLHVPPRTWASEERFAPGTQLVVLASDPYVEADYVHDYADFMRLVRDSAG